MGQSIAALSPTMEYNISSCQFTSTKQRKRGESIPKPLKKMVKMAKQTHPAHQIILMGDFNTKAEKVDELMSTVNCKDIERWNYNNKDTITFIRRCYKGKTVRTQKSALDHAYAILNQPELNFVFNTIDPRDEFMGLGLDLEHFVIMLTLDDKFRIGNDEEDDKVKYEMAKWAPQTGDNDEDAVALKVIMNRYQKVMGSMKVEAKQRKVMERSERIAQDLTWTEFNQTLHANPHHMTNDFVERLFSLVERVAGGEKQGDGKIPKYKTRMGYTLSSPYRDWSMATALFDDFTNQGRNWSALTIAQTKQILWYLMDTRRERYFSKWEAMREKQIQHLLDNYSLQQRQGNHYEAGKYYEKICDMYTNRPTTAKQATMRVIDPRTGELTETNTETANALMNHQKQVETEKLSRYVEHELVMVEVSEREAEKRRDRIERDLTDEEIVEAIAKTKLFKAGGPDGIVSSLLKCALPTNQPIKKEMVNHKTQELALQEALFHYNPNNNKVRKIKGGNYKIFHQQLHYNGASPYLTAIKKVLNEVWEVGITPYAWQMNQICPIPKTSHNSTNPGDYRPICLSSVLQKVLNRCISQRMQTLHSGGWGTKPIINNNRTGYINNRSRVEAILTLLQYVTTNNTNDQRPVYGFFLDLKNAFGSLHCDVMMKVVQNYFPDCPRLHNYLTNMYNTIYIYNRVGNNVSEVVRQEIGTKQGCTLSPFLFNLVFDLIVDGVDKKLAGRGVSIAYADDYTLVCNNEAVFREIIQFLKELLDKAQLDLNVGKSKVMIFNQFAPVQASPNTFEGFEQVSTFKYLGFPLNMGMDFDLFLKTGVDGEVQTKYGRMMRCHQIPNKTKRLVLLQYVYPRLLSNAEIIGMFLWKPDILTGTGTGSNLSKFIKKVDTVWWGTCSKSSKINPLRTITSTKRPKSSPRTSSVSLKATDFSWGCLKGRRLLITNSET